MAKVISVWGSPGSGKSIFSCALAKHLSKGKKKVIIISSDNEVPMLPFWLPSTEVDRSMSLGNIMSSLTITSSLVASKVVMLKKYPFIGLIGYTANDTPLTYPDYSTQKIRDIINESKGLVDYIIIDCSSNSNNLFTPISIEMADTVIGIFTPDLKGIGYFKSHKAILNDVKFKFEEHIFLAGLARPFHPIEEIEQLFGGFKASIPYHKEIEKICLEGGMFDIPNLGSSKYTDALDIVKEACLNE